MKNGRKLVAGLLLSIFTFGLVAVAGPSSNAYAAGPPAGNCPSTAPASWSWSKTGTYYTSDVWCLHDASTNSYLVWQGDGNFVWYSNGAVADKSDTQINTGSRGSGYKLVVQMDGNIAIYDYFGRALWGLQYLNAGYNWHAGTGGTYTISLSHAYINSQTKYATINWYKPGYSATLDTH